MGAKKRIKFLMYCENSQFIFDLSDKDFGEAFKCVLLHVAGKPYKPSSIYIGEVVDDIITQIELESDLQEVKVVKKRKKKSTAKEPLHADIKQCFMNYYELEKKFVYAWAPKDAFGLNQFITKCRNLCVSEKQTTNLAVVLIETIKENSPWVFERLSIGLLNSMFNDIFDACKNGKRKLKSNVSFEESLDISKQNYEKGM